MIDLLPEQAQIVNEIIRRHVPEATVYVFGSRATQKAKPHSDLDLLIVAPEAILLSRLHLMEEAFSESDLPFRVDLVDWHTTSEAFRQVIAQEYVVVQAAKDNES